MIVCTAVISQKDSPVHISTYNEEPPPNPSPNPFHLHSLVHSSLDAISDRLTSAPLEDCYLGLILTEDPHYRILTYVTNTKAKIILVTNDTVSPTDLHLRRVFTQLARCYTDAVSNPFLDAAAPDLSSSKSFSTQLDNIIDDYNSRMKYTEQM